KALEEVDQAPNQIGQAHYVCEAATEVDRTKAKAATEPEGWVFAMNRNCLFTEERLSGVGVVEPPKHRPRVRFAFDAVALSLQHFPGQSGRELHGRQLVRQIWLVCRRKRLDQGLKVAPLFFCGRIGDRRTQRLTDANPVSVHV